MEDVLDVYQRPYDPLHPVVCLDEKGKELHSHRPGREPLPPQPNTPQQGSIRQDYEYKREGSANLRIFCEPLRGWRRVLVNQDRTAMSFAQQVRQVLEEDYPHAEWVELVVDNLNIHGPWSLYDAFPPEEAHRINQRIRWHFTPEHGSWLNMAEIELSVLERQCLNQRFADIDTLISACLVWETDRNLALVKIHWHFTSADARIRLRRLYPVIEDKTSSA